jgi:predicted ATP-grasp superfamily ATP-dependent carboligase
LGWPLVLKPQSSRLYHQNAGIDSFTVAYADGPERLAEQMAPFEGRCPVLLQEYCAGAGDGVELLLHEGRPLAAFQHRRLREVPITGGASAFRESVPLDPLLLDYSTRLLRELRWTGLAMVEFKSSVGGPRLMEINGRVWGSLPLAVRSGMDFPRLPRGRAGEEPEAGPGLDCERAAGTQAVLLHPYAPPRAGRQGAAAATAPATEVGHLHAG